MIRTALVVLLIASVTCNDPGSFKKFKIDLSLDPEERYVEVTKALRNETI